MRRLIIVLFILLAACGPSAQEECEAQGGSYVYDHTEQRTGVYCDFSDRSQP